MGAGEFVPSQQVSIGYQRDGSILPASGCFGEVNIIMSYRQSMFRRTAIQVFTAATAMTVASLPGSGSETDSDIDINEQITASDDGAGERTVSTDGFSHESEHVDFRAFEHHFQVDLHNPALVSTQVPVTVAVAIYDETDEGGYERHGTVEAEAFKDGEGSLYVSSLLDAEDTYRVEHNPVGISVTQPIDRSVLPTKTRVSDAATGISADGTGFTADDNSAVEDQYGAVREWVAREMSDKGQHADWLLDEIDLVAFDGEDAPAGEGVTEHAMSDIDESGGELRNVLLAVEAANGTVVRTPDARLFPEFLREIIDG